MCDRQELMAPGRTVLSIVIYPDVCGGCRSVLAGTDAGLYRSCADTGHFRLATMLAQGIGIQALALSPQFALDRTILAGGEWEQILRSVDAGETWTAASLGSPQAVVTALALSPRFAQDGVALAGTARDGILRSTDRGYSWKRASFGLLSLTIYGLAVAPVWTAAEECALAATEAGLYRSTNGGRAWRLVEGDMERQRGLAAAFSPQFEQNGQVFVGTEGSGVWQSLDGGISWHQIGLDGYVVNCLTFCTSPSGGSFLLAGTSEAGLWRFPTGGGWESLGVQIPPALSMAASGPCLAVGVHEAGIYLSVDYGKTWMRPGATPAHVR